MVSVFRRLFWLAVLAGGGFAAWAMWNSRRPQAAGAATAPAAEWPPLAPPLPVTVEPDPDPEWVGPEGATCPLSHPVKVNTNSGIYHLPGGRSYERTQPQRCYTTAEAAQADGFRAAKS